MNLKIEKAFDTIINELKICMTVGETKFSYTFTSIKSYVLSKAIKKVIAHLKTLEWYETPFSLYNCQVSAYLKAWKNIHNERLEI